MYVVERDRYELIPHPANSPDLALSDFFQFPNLKKDIRGCHFRSDEEVMTAVEDFWLLIDSPLYVTYRRAILSSLTQFRSIHTTAFS